MSTHLSFLFASNSYSVIVQELVEASEQLSRFCLDINQLFQNTRECRVFFYQHCTNIPGVKLKYCTYFGEYVVMINDYSYSNQLEGDIRKRLFSFRKINFLHVILLCHSGRNVTVSQRGLAE